MSADVTYLSSYHFNMTVKKREKENKHCGRQTKCIKNDSGKILTVRLDETSNGNPGNIQRYYWRNTDFIHKNKQERKQKWVPVLDGPQQCPTLTLWLLVEGNQSLNSTNEQQIFKSLNVCQRQNIPIHFLITSLANASVCFHFPPCPSHFITAALDVPQLIKFFGSLLLLVPDSGCSITDWPTRGWFSLLRYRQSTFLSHLCFLMWPGRSLQHECLNYSQHLQLLLMMCNSNEHNSLA